MARWGACILLALAFARAAFGACTPASGYSHADPVTLAAPSSTLTDFPQPSYTGGSNLASLATALAANARSDGFDIIFRTEDPPSTIAHTTIHWDSSTGHWFGYLGPLTRSGELVVCVNYGNAAATSTSSATALGSLEVVTAPNTFATDFTGNGHWPAESGLPTRSAGPIGPAWDLDETVPSFLTLTDSGATIDDPNVFRVSILVKGDAATSELDPERLVWRNNTSTNDRWPIMIWGADSGGNGTIGRQGPTQAEFGPVSGGGWHWITVVYDNAVAGNVRAWTDGALIDTVSPAATLSDPSANLTIGHPSSSVSWSGSVGLFVMGLTTAGDSDAWQAYETAALLNPNSVFSTSGTPTPTVMGPAPAIMFWITNRTPTNSSGLCQNGETALGDGCAGYEYGLDVLLGAGR